jgi:predicted DNA-binding transcriptional regulator AlpA
VTRARHPGQDTRRAYAGGLRPWEPLPAAIATGTARLVGADGRAIDLPDEVARALTVVVAAMADGQAVTIAPHNQTLTTQEAAALLGISRPTLIRLLDAGRTVPGQRHLGILQVAEDLGGVRGEAGASR